jgi:ABC-type uncharacterized transport system permease subunit
MTNDEKPTKDICERIMQFSKLDGATILQVDATVIVGTLFFLTLSSFLGGTEAHAERARLNLSLITGAAILPLSASGAIILLSEYRLKKRLGRQLTGPSRPLTEKDYRKMGTENRFAVFLTFVGFVYLIGAMSTVIYFAFVETTVPTWSEKCGENPEQYGVN